MKYLTTGPSGLLPRPEARRDPVLVTLMLLGVATAVLALVLLAELPTTRLRDALRASLYLAVRRWYLTAASLVILLLLVQVVAQKPALGLGLVPTPMLYLVWAGSRYSLRPALDAFSRQRASGGVA